MKARVKATGEIIEINESSTIYDARMCHVYNASDLESVLDNPDYWTRLEHTYAGMAMHAIITHYANAKLSAKYCSDEAEYYAKGLVNKLKEKEERE